MAARGALPPPLPGRKPPFVQTLKALRSSPLAVIAEYKRASPSEGDINLSSTPEEAAAAYARAGAAALSVLTESEYFKGDISHLARMTGPGLPLLRKDFIFHPLQAAQSAATPASAVLLIARMLTDDVLRDLLRLCMRLDLTPVVEVFDASDLRRAKAAGASVIQVNNRDLQALRVDTTISRRLIAAREDEEFWITASGMRSRGDLLAAAEAGFDAALIGTALMRGGNPEAALSALLQSETDAGAAKGTGSPSGTKAGDAGHA